MNGFLSDNGHPMIRFDLSGFSTEIKQEFEGMIDTGFSGFLYMPILKALPVGLVLASTANYTIADGSQHTTLLCYGQICLDDDTCVTGMVSVANTDADILVGVEFLKMAGKSLNFCPTVGTVELKPCNNEQQKQLPKATDKSDKTD